MQIIPGTPACVGPDVDAPIDTLDDLLTKQADVLSQSRWRSVFNGLPHVLAWRIHVRLEQLQQERPLTGVSLRGRTAGVKTTIVYGIVGNRKWGKSRLAARAQKTRKRRIYNPYIEANQQLVTRKHSSTESATDGSTHE